MFASLPLLAAAPPRQVRVDLDAAGELLGQPDLQGEIWLSYDYSSMVRPLTQAELAEQEPAVVAVRLLISEVGADRLAVSEQGLAEGIAVLYTVSNRLDPWIYDPGGHGVWPYEGCGPEGDMRTCAEPSQYLGLSTWRALEPATRYDPALLEAAVDLAWTAWWLHDTRLAADPTGGATTFVHRCGGAAYGESTRYCDGADEIPDLPGADPVTGPALFRGPGDFLPGRGYYSGVEYARVDYVPAPPAEPADGGVADERASDTGL